MKNIIIGLLVALVILVAWWYFGTRPSQQMMDMNEMKMDHNMNSQTDSSMAGDEMVECLAMGTKMKKSEAYSSTEYKGKTYYFCCAACPGAFKADPEKYVK